MTFVVYVVVVALMAASLLLGILYLIRAYVRYRDSRLIICPQNNEAAIVEVDAVHAALTSALGQPEVRLRNCWRWPIHQACGQECLVQLDVAPQECLVRSVLTRWYESKSCLHCGNPFGQIHLLDPKPALQRPEGRLLNWNEVTAEDFHTTLDSSEPVCWDCYVALSYERTPRVLTVTLPKHEEARPKQINV
jgi:hypothetical protein